jgi:type I restriction enzyme S subunit
MEDFGNLATFSQGIQVDVSNQFFDKQENCIRFLRIIDFVKKTKSPRYIKNPGQRYIKEDGDLVMIRYGASAAGKVFLNHRGAIANNMFKINLTSEKITTRFLYIYLTQPKIYNNLNSNGGTSTMPAITFGQIGAINTPFPTRRTRAHRCHTDKFDTLTNSISKGLPCEIELRQQQYEYYRNLLFKLSKRRSRGIAWIKSAK